MLPKHTRRLVAGGPNAALFSADGGDSPTDIGTIVFVVKAVECEGDRYRIAGTEVRLLNGHDEDAFFAKDLVFLCDDRDIYLERGNVLCALVFNFALDEHRDRAHAHRRFDGVVVGGDDNILVESVKLDGFNHKDDRANIRWRVTAIRAE